MSNQNAYILFYERSLLPSEVELAKASLETSAVSTTCSTPTQPLTLPEEDGEETKTVVQEAPAPVTAVKEAPAPATPVQEAPAPVTPVQEAPAPVTPVQEAPAPVTPVQEAPVQEAPAPATPVKEAPWLSVLSLVSARLVASSLPYCTTSCQRRFMTVRVADHCARLGRKRLREEAGEVAVVKRPSPTTPLTHVPLDSASSDSDAELPLQTSGEVEAWSDVEAPASAPTPQGPGYVRDLHDRDYDLGKTKHKVRSSLRRLPLRSRDCGGRLDQEQLRLKA